MFNYLESPLWKHAPETLECSFKSLIFSELEYNGHYMDIQRLLEYDWAFYTKALRMCQPFDQVTHLLEIHEKEMLTNVQMMLITALSTITKLDSCIIRD